MKENFEHALAAVLHHEGGYTNHPADPGGMTNLGCTKATWEKWCGRQVTEAEMRALEASDVAPLYKEKYWDKVQGDYLPAGVDYAVFDCAINSGPGRSVKLLQEAIGTTPDGAIGPKTLAAIRDMDPVAIINSACDKRLSFLKELPTWGTFGRGWERRVQDVRATAIEMAQA